MPIEYVVLDGGHLVITRLAGEIGNREFADSAARMVDDCRLERPVRQLCDATGLSPESGLRLVGIREAARAKFEDGENLLSRVAIVAERPLAVGLARQFQAYTPEDGAEVQIFEGLEAALRWLGATGREDEVRSLLEGAGG